MVASKWYTVSKQDTCRQAAVARPWCLYAMCAAEFDATQGMKQLFAWARVSADRWLR